MRAVIIGLLGGLATMMLVSQGGAGDAGPDLRPALAAIGKQRILFGHQSVGANILEGLATVAAQAGTTLAIHNVDASPAPEGPVFAHALIPENGEPDLKLQSFSRVLDGMPRVDIAFMKFCFVDFDATTDVDALFARYKAAYEQWAARHPGTLFVHMTTPLTTVQSGPKAWVKRLIGRPLGGTAENRARDRFNEKLRDAYGGREPLFDLARIEATRPDGTAETADLDGRPVPALVPSYSSDGGHLDDEAKAMMARALVTFLAPLAESHSKAAAAANTSASSQ